MAYTSNYQPSMSIPVEPAVLGPIRLARAAGDLNVPVKVPWKNCKLVYAYVVTTTVVATADFEVDLELDAASGTEMMSITVANSGSAVGTVTEATLSNQEACEWLDRDNADRDTINIEAEASAGAGVLDLYMYFEPM